MEEFRAEIDLGKNLPKARVAAISFDKLDLETGMEVADPTGKLARLFHPWSILAWQLAGKPGLEILNGGKGMAERDTAPAENVMLDLLAIPNAEGVASLILLDEVLMYARQKVAGDKGWLTAGIHAAAQASPAREHIRFLGFVEDADLPGLIGAAEVLALVSLWEGFGLPVIEEAAVARSPIYCSREEPIHLSRTRPGNVPRISQGYLCCATG